MRSEGLSLLCRHVNSAVRSRMNMTFDYPVDLSTASTGGYTAVMPDIRDAIAHGDTGVEALGRACEALERALGAYVDRNEVLPIPSPPRGRPVVCPSVGVALKLQIYHGLRDQQITRSDLARRMSVRPNHVTRLLNLSHNSTTAQIDHALKVLGVRVHITGEDVIAALAVR